jgi:hypothetical protein
MKRYLQRSPVEFRNRILAWFQHHGEPATP